MLLIIQMYIFLYISRFYNFMYSIHNNDYFAYKSIVYYNKYNHNYNTISYEKFSLDSYSQLEEKIDYDDYLDWENLLEKNLEKILMEEDEKTAKEKLLGKN